MPSPRYLSAFFLFMAILLPASAMADCHANYDTAVSVFRQALDAVDTGKPLDEAKYELDYTSAVNGLVKEKCQIELMQLYQMAEEEKQKRNTEPEPNQTQPPPEKKPLEKKSSASPADKPGGAKVKPAGTSSVPGAQK